MNRQVIDDIRKAEEKADMILNESREESKSIFNESLTKANEEYKKIMDSAKNEYDGILSKYKNDGENTAKTIESKFNANDILNVSKDKKDLAKKKVIEEILYSWQ